MLTVHHLGHSQSDRIVWLCEELGIQYELKKYDRSPLLSPPELRALHPIGAAPVIEDGDVKLAESSACIEYIANIHGNGRLLVKPGAKNYADFLYYYHLTNGTYQPAVGRVMAMKFAGITEDNPTYVRYNGKVHQVLAQFNEQLATNAWLAGDEFSVADIMVVFSFTTMREFVQVDMTGYDNILAYLKRATSRPAYQKYLEKADPDIDISQSILGKPPLPFKALRK